MKLLTFLLLALWSACMVSAKSSSQPQQRALVSELEDDQAWPVGTPVYYEYHGDWYAGSITKYFNGVYTVTWAEDGQVEYFDDPDVVDKMVQAAKNNQDPTTYNVGTAVYRYFDTDKKFHHGEIIEYSNGSYKVRWSTGLVETYPAGVEIDALVQAADSAQPVTTATAATTTAAPTTSTGVVRETTATQATGTATVAPTAADTEATTPDTTSDTTVDVTMQGSFEIGTKVYKYFEGEGYFWGTISWYSDGVYTITWEDKSKEKYDNLQEVIQMVERAARQNQGDSKESDPWENGTAVFRSFSTGDLFGEIILYQDGKYKVRWSNGDVEQYSIAQTDSMVKAAYEKVEAAKAAQSAKSQEAAKSKKNVSGGVKFLIVLLVFVVIVLSFFCVRRIRRGKAKTKVLESVHKDDDENLAPAPTYQDQPDAEAPLPDVI